MCVSNFGKRLRFVHNAKIYRLIWDPGRRKPKNSRIHEFESLGLKHHAACMFGYLVTCAHLLCIVLCGHSVSHSVLLFRGF